MTPIKWLKRLTTKFRDSYLIITDRIEGRKPVRKLWRGFEDNVRELLGAVDLVAAARVREKVTGEPLVIPDKPTVRRVVEVNDWTRAHVEATAKVVEERARAIRRIEKRYYSERSEALRDRPEEIPAWRMNMIFRNATGSVQEEAEQVQLSSAFIGGMFPYSVYMTREDRRVRPTHAQMNKFVALRSWPGWLEVRPKNGFNCRCYLIHKTWSEAIRRGWASGEDRPHFEVKWPNIAAKANYQNGLFPDDGWTGPKYVAGLD